MIAPLRRVLSGCLGGLWGPLGRAPLPETTTLWPPSTRRSARCWPSWGVDGDNAERAAWPGPRRLHARRDGDDEPRRDPAADGQAGAHARARPRRGGARAPPASRWWGRPRASAYGMRRRGRPSARWTAPPWRSGSARHCTDLAGDPWPARRAALFLEAGQSTVEAYDMLCSTRPRQRAPAPPVVPLRRHGRPLRRLRAARARPDAAGPARARHGVDRDRP